MARPEAGAWRGAALCALLAAAPVAAQGPGDEAFPAPPPSELERRLTGAAGFVRVIRVQGAKSLPAELVAETTAPFENRVLSPGEVRDLQRRLTRLYADRGYISSGVVVDEGALQGDVLTLRAVEGTVARVRFTRAPHWSRPQYLTRLLVPDDDEPVRLEALQERLAWLRDTGVVDRINAEIVPLPQLGRSELVVEVEEPRPWAARIDYDNHHSPTLGARRATLNVSHRNVTGWGDAVDARYGDTPGLNDAMVAYAVPIPFTALRVGARWERSDSLAISPASFRSLDIKALSSTAAIEASYALLRRASSELSVFAAHERRRSDTTLLGIPFSFVPGIDDGRSRVNVVRAGVNYLSRGASSVLFARVQASAGRTNVAPSGEGDAFPAARFVSYFAQAQYARRLPWSLQAVARVEAQFAPDTLLPLEKYAIGGSGTVRGYRENLVLRDRAVLGSLELQRPVLDLESGWKVMAAAFVDGAASRNSVPAEDGLPRSLASYGVGLAISGPWGISARVYAARPSQRWLTPRDDLQDRGIHYILSWEPTKLIP